MFSRFVIWHAAGVFLLCCTSFSILVNGGKNSNVKDELYQASYIGDVTRVEFLLSLDPDVLSSRSPILFNRRNEPYGRTAIMVCGIDPQKDSKNIDVDCSKIVRLIHAAGGHLNLTDNAGWDALSLAAFRGLSRLTKYIAQTKQVPINRVDKEGRSPLMKAAANGYNTTYTVLVKNGADLQQQDPKGKSSLHYVTLFAIKDHESGLSFLQQALHLHAHHNILHLLDYDKRNILMYAAIANDVQVVEIILNHLAATIASPSSTFKLDQQDNYKMTALAMTTSQRVKELLTTWEIDLVIKQHELWLVKQREILVEDDQYDLDGDDNQHVLVTARSAIESSITNDREEDEL